MTPEQGCEHEWAATPIEGGAHSYACTQCGETTHACQDCAAPMTTSLTICDRCLNRARKVITDIREYIAAINADHRVLMGLRTIRPPEPMTAADELHGIRYDKTGSPAAGDEGRLPFGLNVDYDDPTPGPGGIRTATGALDLLEAWVDDWVRLSGDPAGASDTLAYLEAHTLWAAQNHPAWGDYLSEARATRAVVRRLAGLDPDREPAPCVHCGGAIIHGWTPHGYDDTARCVRCHRWWPNHQALAFANRYHIRALPDEAPDMLVTRDEIRLIFPQLRPGTLRQWINRGHLPVHGHDPQGRPWYQIADVSARIQQEV